MRRQSTSMLIASCLVAGIGCGSDKAQTTAPSATATVRAQPPLPEGAPRFSALDAARSGVDFINALPENRQLNVLAYQYFYNGAGVSIGDVDGDDEPDLFFVGNLAPNRLYKNKGGLHFADVTEAAGLAKKGGWSTGSTMVDIDADGDLDIYVCRSGRVDPPLRANQLFINKGQGIFEEKAAAFGLADTGYSTQATFFDYDLDGDLDVLVLNHPIDPYQGAIDPGELRNVRDPNAGDRLYRNDGGRFVDVSEAAGIHGSPIGYALSASVGDLDRDGDPDIYVANDFTERDYLYVNRGDGTFEDVSMKAMPHTSQFSMGSDIADYDNDGWLDLLVADMAARDHYRAKTMMKSMNVPRFRRLVKSGFHYQYSFNALQRNNHDGTYSDMAQLAGVARTDWSWAALLADLDNDGFKDAFITNGRRKDSSNVDFTRKKDELLAEGPLDDAALKKLLAEIPQFRVPNTVFRNGGAHRFEDVGQAWGLDWKGTSTGAAYADLDGDGDLDLVVNNIDDPAIVFENRSNRIEAHKALMVKLRGPAKNPMGIGARVDIQHGDVHQVAEHQVTRGYQSSVAPGLHFGLGKATVVDRVEVRWPDGKRQVLEKVDPAQTLVLSYDGAGAAPPTFGPEKSKPAFVDVTAKAGLEEVRHQENEFDDLEREILLPYETSKLGPALAVGDVDGDGVDDVYLGGALDTAGRLFLQRDTFTEVEGGPFGEHAGREDVVALFFDADGDGDLDLFVGSGGNEVEADDARLADRLYLNDGKGKLTYAKAALPALRTSTGAVAAGDVDGDGDLDLFVGGRVVPGRYPEAPRSYLLRNDEGKFVDATKEVAPQLERPGMVTAAAFADIDGDGDQDLVVAGEWMPLTVAKNDGKTLAPTPIAGTEGWWRSVAVDDLDGDGKVEIVAGNVGLNLKFSASPTKTFDVYAYDFDDSGSLDIVLSHREGTTQFPVRGRECSSQQMPFVKEQFGSYEAYGKASLRDVYGDKLDKALHLTTRTFESVVVRQDGKDWQVTALPPLAQMGSIDGIVVRDVDGDGKKDLVVAGNLEKTEVETPRVDGGTGLVLQQTEKGWSAWPVPKSGFHARGDVKRLLALRLKGGGMGLFVARNDGPVSLFAAAK